MGLSICLSIIQAHGGRIWAAPNAPRGTVFNFVLPVDGETSADAPVEKSLDIFSPASRR